MDVSKLKQTRITGRPIRISKEDKKKIIQLVLDGYTQQSVGDFVGVSQGRVSQIMRDYRNGDLVL
ncbi:sigma factor-like helix-turn-helix DNA-binding protein [Aliivibrio sp. S4TY2]|uniref:sigma factor-like helix-turn-helix DNA-binding protein n=1 Tax=unclassified Aliivibrio TaxID=2645654 RepID=UPI002378BDCC|nr:MULTISPECIES: sigma factor-like helix-turn-helix DNA-binding protein [unclassified Aliivibrio]MDD9156416.1 sigma factor-like helix-turn-helix DNA-binding protein [Aliivibrio sp. S4TY2]MDD9162346.1 sigma factor-like helix-turn-helix DNA-binding protein [Aliivibrio sp. S4TY1]MDD9164124.1 sigma factor-like helix-turn-helix DNA-binding protein [Aliivibrio sp. S4MY2]MDD9167903.1 sigma factor-like helix-turn-helix DNA-binding protein [Aliivibrio sp. S4MY4]MDD9187432.1 sigma factor-like helix-turn